jgi:hypothetical protein
MIENPVTSAIRDFFLKAIPAIIKSELQEIAVVICLALAFVVVGLTLKALLG